MGGHSFHQQGGLHNHATRSKYHGRINSGDSDREDRSDSSNPESYSREEDQQLSTPVSTKENAIQALPSGPKLLNMNRKALANRLDEISPSNYNLLNPLTTVSLSAFNSFIYLCLSCWARLKDTGWGNMSEQDPNNNAPVSTKSGGASMQNDTETSGPQKNQTQSPMAHVTGGGRASPLQGPTNATGSLSGAIHSPSFYTAAPRIIQVRAPAMKGASSKSGGGGGGGPPSKNNGPEREGRGITGGQIVSDEYTSAFVAPRGKGGAGGRRSHPRPHSGPTEDIAGDSFPSDLRGSLLQYEDGMPNSHHQSRHPSSHHQSQSLDVLPPQPGHVRTYSHMSEGYDEDDNGDYVDGTLVLPSTSKHARTVSSSSQYSYYGEGEGEGRRTGRKKRRRTRRRLSQDQPLHGAVMTGSGLVLPGAVTTTYEYDGGSSLVPVPQGYDNAEKGSLGARGANPRHVRSGPDPYAPAFQGQLGDYDALREDRLGQYPSEDIMHGTDSGVGAAVGVVEGEGDGGRSEEDSEGEEDEEDERGYERRFPVQLQSFHRQAREPSAYPQADSDGRMSWGHTSGQEYHRPMPLSRPMNAPAPNSVSARGMPYEYDGRADFYDGGDDGEGWGAGRGSWHMGPPGYGGRRPPRDPRRFQQTALSHHRGGSGYSYSQDRGHMQMHSSMHPFDPRMGPPDSFLVRSSSPKPPILPPLPAPSSSSPFIPPLPASTPLQRIPHIDCVLPLADPLRRLDDASRGLLLSSSKLAADSGSNKNTLDLIAARTRLTNATSLAGSNRSSDDRGKVEAEAEGTLANSREIYLLILLCCI